MSVFRFRCRKLLPKLVGGLLAVLALSAGMARADLLTYSDSIPLQSTNWHHNLTVPQFNPGLGTLNSVTINLKTHVEGTHQFESLDAEPSTVDITHQAKITLRLPDGTPWLKATADLNTEDTVTAYDGILDYAGTSGRSYMNLEADLSASKELTDASSLWALFTGSGTLVLPVEALGSFVLEGPGNFDAKFTTMGSAELTTTFDYRQAPVPEPSSLALLGLGGAGLFLYRRHRRGGR